jgi:ATP-dependent DNA helicase RecG
VEDSEFTESGPSGIAQLVFFSYKKNYITWMLSKLRTGEEVVVCGTPTVFNNTLQFAHPEVLVIGEGFDAGTADEALEKVTKPVPVYHATARFSSERIHECILEALTALEDHGEGVPDIIPESVREVTTDENGRVLLSRGDAFRAIHRPDSVAAFHRGIYTMRFEEAFVSQISLLHTRAATQKTDAFPCPDVTAQPDSLPARLLESLPFDLTDGQREVTSQISHDLASVHPMQRLMQGEVGSGKTIVALLAMLQVVDAGYQSVLVAPTQVLAEQHYRKITEQCEALGAVLDGDVPPVVLLTGALKLAQRRRVLALVASGEPCIVIATHSAFSKTFQAPKLALAIIDEQHRFGVEQRDALTSKSERTPHLLVMTATPIPRTAAMTWFGDLEISELKGLPGGRKPISTFVIPEADNKLMATMLWHLRKRIDAGERAYVVCPAIDEASAAGEPGDAEVSAKKSAHNAAAEIGADYVDLFDDAGMDDTEAAEPKPPLHSVAEISTRFAALPQFSGISVATLTGRDDEETKTRVMADFASGATPLLVSTTVIEVGVDVSAASCIVIFDADRFGLSQLHQLRGRVGRGGTQGWAFLVSRAEPDSVAAQRLEVIRTSTDGATIAQADIELRGVGDVLGDAQSGGKSSLKLLRVVKDAPLITQAREEAQKVLDASGGDLSAQPQLAGAILDFMHGKEKYLTRT